MGFDWFKRKRTEDTSAGTQQPSIPWLDAAQNPWGVPVLDIRPVTLNNLSLSEDPRCAMNVNSFVQEDGRCFAIFDPPESRQTKVDLRYRIDRVIADGILFTPTEMEHKWAIFCHGQKIIFVRSWLRQVVAVAHFRSEGEFARITTLHGTFTNTAELPDFSARVLDYLLRSHALDLPYPAPLPMGMESDPLTAANWCMGMFGNKALVATPHVLSDALPKRSLRSDSLLHIAVARGESHEVKKLLDGGLPIDLFDRHGLTPLHWAIERDDTMIIDFLLDLGCPVDVRSEEGATCLMGAVQKGNKMNVKFLLDRGADPNAGDARGFTALHRAAELGNREAVHLLIERGAEKSVVAQGHTPHSLAKKVGHAEILMLLAE